MSNHDITLLSPESLPIIVYRGQRVLTTELLASQYAVPPKNLQVNYQNNKFQFQEELAFFRLEGAELKAFRANLYTESFGAQIVGPMVRVLYLWTGRGALLHAKMLNTPKAWEVHHRLVDIYFLAQSGELPPPSAAALPSSLPSTATMDLDKFAKLDRAAERGRELEYQLKMDPTSLIKRYGYVALTIQEHEALHSRIRELEERLYEAQQQTMDLLREWTQLLKAQKGNV